MFNVDQNLEASVLINIFLMVLNAVMQVNHALEPVEESSTTQERHAGEYRIGTTSCSKENIIVDQGPSGTLPNGIPTYTVIVSNACVFESCSSISNIHLSCGWFSSARLINPSVILFQFLPLPAAKYGLVESISMSIYARIRLGRYGNFI